jgi:hypothetical protein
MTVLWVEDDSGEWALWMDVAYSSVTVKATTCSASKFDAGRSCTPLAGFSEMYRTLTEGVRTVSSTICARNSYDPFRTRIGVKSPYAVARWRS